MRADINVISLPKSLTLDVKHKKTEYKGYLLLSNVAHCGIAGNYWVISVLDKRNVIIDSFCSDSFIETEQETRDFIDKLIV